jgi:glycosyltransferase involved in cell wall biosynthesis
MRIAVCQRVCPEYIIPLFQQLSRRYEIDFIFSRFGQDQAFFFDPARISGIRVLALRPPPFPLLPFRSRVLNKLAFWTHLLVLAAQLARTLGRGRYDVVVGGDFGRFECVVACLWARWRRRPFLLWSDTWHWPVTRRDRVRLPLVRWMIRSATALIAGGSQAAKKLAELGARPIFNVYHTNVSVALGTRVPERFVLYVGRLDERKGVDHLLRAFARLDAARGGTRLTIVGLGAREAALRRLAGELGIASAVDFAGWVDHKEIGGYYRRCAVFVLPSIFTDDGGYEPFSNVVLEAMAWGAPVITTLANGAAYDVLEDGVNGRVVPDRDPDALAAALRDLLADPQKAEAMGARGRETVHVRFNVDRMADRFAQALDYGLAAASRSR